MDFTRRVFRKENNSQTSEVLTFPQPRILRSDSIKKNGSPASGVAQRGLRARERVLVCVCVL